MSTTSMAIFSNPLFATYSVYARNASIAVSAIQRRAEIFYIGAHLRSRPWTNAVEFSSNPSAVYTKWGAQTFLPIFGLLTKY